MLSGKISDLFFSSYIRLDVKDKYGILSDITKTFSKIEFQLRDSYKLHINKKNIIYYNNYSQF